MADVLVDTILGRDDQMDPTTLDIGLIITDRALFSPDDGEIAQVEGYGAVPAEAVREQLRAALRDPKTPQEDRSEEHTSELQSRGHLVCRLLLEKKKKKKHNQLRHTRTRHTKRQ